MSEFTWIPDFTIAGGSEHKTLESEMENGVKQYRQKWPSQMRTWKLSFKNRTLTETLAIEAFFNLKYGKATSFTWTNPRTNVEYTVRFKTDKLSYDEHDYDSCDFEIEFEEDMA